MARDQAPPEAIPPQDQVAEQNLLGAILLGGQRVLARAQAVLGQEGETFYFVAHEIVYNATRALALAGQPIDLVTVSGWLEDHGLLGEVGGRGYLADLLGAIATTANVEHYASRVAEKATRRRLIAAARTALEAAYDQERELEVVLDVSQRAIFAVQQGRASAADPEAEEAAIEGEQTSILALDNLLLGMMPGNLIIVGGEASEGKTALALTIARNVAARGGPVLFVSREMSAEELAGRLVSSASEVDGRRIRKGWFFDADWARLGDAIGKVAELPIWIEEQAATVGEIAAGARRLGTEVGGLRLVVVDYLQLLEGGGTRGEENRALEVARISRGLKALARELRCPVMALAQLNRLPAEVKVRKPHKGRLRECGAIEHDADVIILLWRPDQQEVNRVQAVVDKNRNGPKGDAELFFRPRIVRFESVCKRGTRGR